MRCGNCGNELRGEARFCSKCGAPVPQAQPSYSAPPAGTFGDAPRAPLSGAGQPRKKSGCGKVLLVLLIIGLLVLAGLAVAGYFAYRFAEDKLKSSEAYTHAVERLKADPEVTGKMGEIRETGFPLGAFNENADGTGTAVFRMSVTGAKASGNYDVSMSRSGGRWIMHTGKVTLKSGEEIEVESDDDGAAKPPELFGPPTPPAKPGATGPGKPISGGVLNGKAISKPEPAYPAVAKAARASGTVTVQVTVDESGKVTSANAVSGHPLLRQAAVQAAYQAKFSPTLLSGKPVKVTGIITYNFNLPAEGQQP